MNCAFVGCNKNNYFLIDLYFKQFWWLYEISIYFNITYIVILATCFDSYESSSGINIQELLVHIVLQFFMSVRQYVLEVLEY